MEHLWTRIRALQGQELRTPRRQKSFEVVYVGEEVLVVLPKGGKGIERPIHREDIEQAAHLGLKGEGLTPSAIQRANPPGFNASYVASILRKVESHG